jgi:hypothetical protein
MAIYRKGKVITPDKVRVLWSKEEPPFAIRNIETGEILQDFCLKSLADSAGIRKNELTKLMRGKYSRTKGWVLA